MFSQQVHNLVKVFQYLYSKLYQYFFCKTDKKYIDYIVIFKLFFFELLW